MDANIYEESNSTNRTRKRRLPGLLNQKRKKAITKKTSVKRMTPADRGRSKYAKGVKGFLQFLKEKNPKIYGKLQTARPELFKQVGLEGVGLGETLMDKIVGGITSIAPGFMQLKLMKENYKRAKAGLPPIDPSTMSPSVSIDMSDEIKEQIKGGMGAAKGLMFAGMGVLALLAMRMFKK